MPNERPFSSIATRIREFIAHSSSRVGVSGVTSSLAQSEPFETLALELFSLQRSANPVYAALCRSRGFADRLPSSWKEIPAVPTSAFKEFEVTCLSPEERTAVFHSSGTTAQVRSRHFHSDDSLKLYQASLLPWFEAHLLADLEALVDQGNLRDSERPGMIFLTPPPSVAPTSSLVHMLDAVRREWASTDSLFAGVTDAEGAWSVDQDRFLFALRKSMCANRPLWIFGTAFNFVHMLDRMEQQNQRYRLAVGSRVVETGGYKGRSRWVAKGDLHQMITRHLGIPATAIACEYGMSELSSQAYDVVVKTLDPETNEKERTFCFPPWARSLIVSPETGKEVEEGEVGILRIVDLANAYSVLAIQTEDLARRVGDRFELLGRPSEAERRGCSLMSPAS